MKLAIMQPYFLPYIGYFQLMHAVDSFVFLDDVNFIRRGWIQRNRVLHQDKPLLFTIPVNGASQNRKICELELMKDGKWQGKLLRLFQHSYAKAPTFDATFPLLEELVNHPDRRLNTFLANSLKRLAKHLDLPVQIYMASELGISRELSGAARILAFCKSLNAKQYINSIGGLELYQREAFAKDGIELSFLKSLPKPYRQSESQTFLPNLSVVDTLMFNDQASFPALLSGYQLV